MSNIIKRFKDSWEQENTRDLIADISDNAFDLFVKSETIKAIPFFNYLNSGIKICEDIKKHRFAKKIYRFLYHTSEIGSEERDRFIAEYGKANQEDGYEAILSEIDRMDNINKIDIMARFLKSRVEGKISIETFIRLTIALERIPYTDIGKLPDYLTDHYEPGVTDMLNISGVLYDSQIYAEQPSQYKLNELGQDFLKYGLNYSFTKAKRGGVKTPEGVWAEFE